MDPSSNVRLKLYWQAPYINKGWEAESVRTKMKESSHNIESVISRPKSEQVEQRLTFRLEHKKNSHVRLTDSLIVPIDLVKTIKVSFSTFQFYEQTMRYSRTDVTIDSFPEFEAENTYKIKIIYRE
ncbi:MAG: hypothetical protein O7C60_02085, partial [Rickettsia endosymbiont of Ixodes persulcatus]|nr:hypothetical protein [Rickettsia endosymbiont of Ixodes persulcatus]